MEVRDAPFMDLEDFKDQTKADAGTMRKLAAADVFRSMGLDRRQALWDARALKDAPDLPLFAQEKDEGAELMFALPQMPTCEHVVADYQTLRLSLKAHPMSFLRSSMKRQGYSSAHDLKQMRNGQRISMAGIVLIRQRPGTAKGVCFITLEDEVGLANLVVWSKVMAKYRKVVMRARIIDVRGIVQREGEVIHIVVHHLVDRTDALDRLSNHAPDKHVTGIPKATHRHPRDVRIIPKSRDFH
jgi:error-prone DNA polymerase